MAQRVRVLLTDDLDGGDADETVTFAPDGKGYEIDLSKKNADKLRTALHPFLDAARFGGRSPTGAGRRARGSRERGAQAVIGTEPRPSRDWAKSQGMKVSERGRISAEIADAYEAAHA
jgi:Lsr2